MKQTLFLSVLMLLWLGKKIIKYHFILACWKKIFTDIQKITKNGFIENLIFENNFHLSFNILKMN